MCDLSLKLSIHNPLTCDFQSEIFFVQNKGLVYHLQTINILSVAFIISLSLPINKSSEGYGVKNIFLEQSYVEKVLKKLKRLGSLFHYEVLDEVRVKDRHIPIYGFQIGPQDKNLPVLGMYGGVHGLEKIGTHVIVNYLNSVSNKIAWNMALTKNLENLRIVSIPIVNPGGMFLNQRSNPNGVDLMRNGPVDADQKLYFPSGQTFSSKLPWYRGNPQQMEQENRVLFDFVKTHMFGAPFSLALDIHSGFGWRDSLWYPYGKTMKPCADVALAQKLARYFKVSHPFHKYKIEQQSQSYMIHGDMWDFMYDSFKESGVKGKFLPWTLEIGTWSWLLSRPHRIFDVSGLFHTDDTAKYRRLMRKHWALLDFFKDMAIHHEAWVKKQTSKENLDRIVGL